jgi:hypothetical protein
VSRRHKPEHLCTAAEKVSFTEDPAPKLSWPWPENIWPDKASVGKSPEENNEKEETVTESQTQDQCEVDHILLEAQR